MSEEGPIDATGAAPGIAPGVRTRLRDRPALMWSVIAIAGLLPIAALGILSYQLAAASIRRLVQSNNSASAMMMGETVSGDLEQTTSLALAIARMPEVIDAVERHDEEGVRQRLRAAVVSSRRVERAFITDSAGVEWSDFPNAPESIGKSFAHRDWYRGVSREWKPYVSEVYRRNATPNYLIVAVAVPIRSQGPPTTAPVLMPMPATTQATMPASGRVIGILVLQLRLEDMSEVLKPIVLGDSGYVLVLDHTGTVAAHPSLDMQARQYPEYAGLDPVRRAMAGDSTTQTYTDPIAQREMIATFLTVQVGEQRWVVVAQQPAAEAYAPIRRLALHITLAVVILAIGGVGLVLVLRRQGERNRRLNVKLERQNHDLENLAEELEHTASSERSLKVEAQTAHEKLRETQAQLVQTEKLAALGQLVAGVAHEINNPLAFVTNNVCVLQRDVKDVLELLATYRSANASLAATDPELGRRVVELAQRMDLDYTSENLPSLLDRSREGLRRIQQIVKDLRDFARHDAVGERQEDADLNPGVESTMNIIRGRARKQQVELIADLGTLPPVNCAPAKINQVVLNLLSNAIDACDPGGTVTVRTRPAGDGVEIQVIDTGKGIPPDIRERIFDPFFTTKPQGQGTGLGLSISHGIVADHDGRITVDSTVGKGTTFTVYLPLKPPPQARRPAQHGTSESDGNGDPTPAQRPIATRPG